MLENTVSKLPLFIDRKELIADFKQQCKELKNESDKSKVIYFNGVPGIGKTALLKHLMEPSNKVAGYDYIYHDFDSLNDMRSVLKKLKRRISQLGCEFPMFEFVNYLYELSIGENAMPPSEKKLQSDNPFLSKIFNSKLFTAALSGVTLYTTLGAGAIPVGLTGLKFVADTASASNKEDILEAIVNGFNKYVLGEKNDKLDHREYVNKYIEELKENENYSATRREENQIENELLRFFTEDLTYWLMTSNKKLVIFLDSYEILQDKGRKIKEHPEPDWWLKGEENLLTGDKWSGLLMSIPNVVWVLSGRKELKFTGELGEKLQKRELEPFNDTYSMQFLCDRGITNNIDLCLKLTKLTRGYPLYLELCGQQYRMLKNKHRNYEPAIADFGSENGEFDDRVGKLVHNLIESMDDTGIREMIKYLCVIKDWTDDIADEIIPVYNDTAYNLIKDFSFIRNVNADDEDAEKIFRFDSNVQEILIRKYKKENKPIVKRALNGINKYFNNCIDKLIEQDKELYNNREKFEQYLKTWSATIIRLIDDPRKLMNQFEENIQLYLRKSYSHTEEEILTLFFEKIKTISEEESLPYAFFELHMAFAKNRSWYTVESLEYAKSACEKFRNLRATEDSRLIDLLIFNSLGIISDSMKEIEDNIEDVALKKELVEVSKTVCRDYPDKIFETMCSYAEALEKIKNFDEAFNVREEILKFAENNFPEREGSYIKRVKAMHSLASYYTKVDRLGLLKECVSLLKREKHPDTAKLMEEVAEELNSQGKIDEELQMRQQIWEYIRNTEGDEGQSTINAANSLAAALENYKHKKKAEQVRKEAYEQRAAAFESHVKRLKDNDPETIDLMKEWADALYELYNRSKEEIDLRREIWNRCKNIYGEYEDETINNLSLLSSVLHRAGLIDESEKIEAQVLETRKLAVEYFKNSNVEGHVFKYIAALKNLARESALIDEETVNLYRQIVKIVENNMGIENIDIYDYIHSLKDLAENLKYIEGSEEEIIKIYKEVIDLCKKHYGFLHQHTMLAVEDLAEFYQNQNLLEDAILLYKELLEMRRKAWGDSRIETIWKMQYLGDIYHEIGNYEEEIHYKRWALKCARKRGEKRKQTIYAMRKLADVFNNNEIYKEEYKDEMLGLYEKALEISTERFGDSDYTIETMKLYADALCLAGEKDAAEKIESQLNTMHNSFSNDYESYGHEDIDEDVINERKKKRKIRTLIRSYQRSAKDLETEGRFEELLDVQKKLLEQLYEQKSNEENVISITFEMADTLEKLERSEERKNLVDELEQKLKESLSQYKDNDEYNEAYIEKLKNLELFLARSERYEEALEIQRKISEGYKELGDTEQFIDSLKNVGNLLAKLENEEEIQDNRKQIIDEYKKLRNERLEEFSEDDREVLEVMKNWANFLECVDRYEEALEIRQKILAISIKSYEEEKIDYYDYIGKLEDVAYDLRKLKRYDEEVEIIKQIVNIYQENDELEDYTINELVEALENANRSDEAKEWINKLKDTDND